MKIDFIRLVVFGTLLLALLLIVFMQALSLAFHKLGLGPEGVFLLLFASLFGSAFNLPLFQVESAPRWPDEAWDSPRLQRTLLPPFEERTLIAANVGGCLVPLLFSVYLLTTGAAPLGASVIGILVVTVASRLLSRPVYGVGIGMPLFVAPVLAALVAVLLGGEQRAALAYVSGTSGVLIGADLLRLPDVRRIGAPIAAIGGAGTFDGIFLTGVFAVLLT